ncbi:uncharacterized protein B0T15DRAFT_490291 [Chaetomium strumarium]|uniref:Uncharacterized protein n=1 Tax=Chaetomium strumarium TaxID=1170767 RepID=A0AAJ0H4J6_9PEZI|nr:hypothetical protein B0T15DRAFT_490291 [Chaetomium strumarium]
MVWLDAGLPRSPALRPRWDATNTNTSSSGNELRHAPIWERASASRAVGTTHRDVAKAHGCDGASATPTPGPGETGASATLARSATRASASSAISTATDESVKTLNTLANIISRDLHSLDALAKELKTWAEQIDPAVYAQKQIGDLADWPPDVKKAYKDYKAAVDRHHVAKAAYDAYLATNRQVTNPERPEMFQRRAELAIKWGKAACRGLLSARSPGPRQ